MYHCKYNYELHVLHSNRLLLVTCSMYGIVNTLWACIPTWFRRISACDCRRWQPLTSTRRRKARAAPSRQTSPGRSRSSAPDKRTAIWHCCINAGSPKRDVTVTSRLRQQSWDVYWKYSWINVKWHTWFNIICSVLFTGRTLHSTRFTAVPGDHW